jgi:flagellar protein FlbD
MIRLTRSGGTSVVLNADLIEHMEATPDTVITLTTDAKFRVQESLEEVMRRVLDYRRAVQPPLHRGHLLVTARKEDTRA